MAGYLDLSSGGGAVMSLNPSVCATSLDFRDGALVHSVTISDCLLRPTIGANRTNLIGRQPSLVPSSLGNLVHHVRFRITDPEMVRVHAKRNIALVADVASLWDSPVPVFVSPSVSKNTCSRVAVSARACSHPYPTVVRDHDSVEAVVISEFPWHGDIVSRILGTGNEEVQ